MMKGWEWLFYCLAIAVIWQWQDHLGDTRVAEQGKLLGTIEALHTPGTDHFVATWRHAHPSPSAQTISELNIVAAKLKNDPAQAPELEAQIKFDPTWAGLMATFKVWMASDDHNALTMILAILVPFSVFVPLLTYQVYRRHKDYN
jgi:hypothetical protein